MGQFAADIREAIRSGPIPTRRQWRRVKMENLTRAERVMRFMEDYLVVPEGTQVGQPLRLAPFQQAFIYAIYDNPAGTRKAYLSIARKNGKSALIAGIILAHAIGPEARRNSQIRSGARSRDQAALVFHLAEKMVRDNPALADLYRVVPSSKMIVGLRKNVEYKALSADASRAHGLSPVLAILDETGQIRGPTDAFVEAITTSQGAHDDPLLMVISTSAPTDRDLFNVWVDDATRSDDPSIVCHVYAADADAELMDRSQWKKANPALGTFRSMADLEDQLEQASRVPSMESAARNLLLNQRIAQDSIWLAPSVWKANRKPPSWSVFEQYGVYIGLDLSRRNDLTAAVLAQLDDDAALHLWPFVFLPEDGLLEKARRDRAPYDAWVRDGQVVAVPGKTLDYEWLTAYLRREVEDAGVFIHQVAFDRWRINEFRAAAERTGFAQGAVWSEVGQGYKDMSPRVESFETALLQERIRHGEHPALNQAAAAAVVVGDPSGNRKLAKDKATHRIDPLVAAIMAAHPLIAMETSEFDVAALVG